MKIVACALLVPFLAVGQIPKPSPSGLAVAPTTIVMGLPLTGASFPAVRASNIAANDVDLYTAPTGKRVLVMTGGGYNPTLGSITSFFEIKSGGTYYRITTNAITVTASTITAQPLGIVLEPGEILAINSTALGLNISVSALQFDSTSGLRTAKVLGAASGNSTLYTVPAGKTAWATTAVGQTWNTASSLIYVGDSGGAGLVNVCSVLSGGSTACAANSVNELSSVSVSASTRSTIGFTGITLGAGDFIVINVATGNAAQIGWVNVLEF